MQFDTIVFNVPSVFKVMGTAVLGVFMSAHKMSKLFQHSNPNDVSLRHDFIFILPEICFQNSLDKISFHKYLFRFLISVYFLYFLHIFWQF